MSGPGAGANNQINLQPGTISESYDEYGEQMITEMLRNMEISPQQQHMGLSLMQQPQQISNQTSPTVYEKIWFGVLEWFEKAKSENQPRVMRQVQCQVTAKVGQIASKGDNWPPKFIMQLIPKHILIPTGIQFLRDSKIVCFHPLASEALDDLSKVMSSGFAGCVHFCVQPSNAVACDISVLILIFAPEKKTFLGFIPNDQKGFIARLRTVIAQRQST